MSLIFFHSDYFDMIIYLLIIDLNSQLVDRVPDRPVMVLMK